MYYLTRTYTFDAAHKLILHDGKCKQLHGHTFTVKVTVKGIEICTDGNKKNMLIDFHDLDKIVKPIIDSLDHQYLNDKLKIDSPTSEYLAKNISEVLAVELLKSDYNVLIHSVCIQETPKSECIYVPEY